MNVSESSKYDAVEVIRKSLRELSYVERKEHREKLLNKNRIALGSIVTNSAFTTEFVIVKAKALKKKVITVEEYKQLQNALIQSEENVNSFLKVDNILFALVRDISATNPTLRLSAISCCCNIALGNTKACTSLAKSIAPYLITELDSLNRPLLEVCIWTVGNLVGGSLKAFEILHAQDCIKYIISLLHTCDNDILPSVTYAAMHYVHVGHQHISQSKLIELVKASNEKDLSFNDPYFIWLIALLSSVEACNAYLYDRVPFVVDYLYQNVLNDFIPIIQITACIRILANTVCEVSGQVARFLLNNSKYAPSNFEVLLNKLLSCQHIHIRRETLWLLGNLYNHNSDTIRNTMENVIPQLSSLKQAIISTRECNIVLNTD